MTLSRKREADNDGKSVQRERWCAWWFKERIGAYGLAYFECVRDRSFDVG